MSPSIELISGLGIAFALFFGVKNGMGEGDFFSLIIALYMIYTPLKKISAIQNKLKVLEAPLARVESLLDMETTIRSPQFPKPINKPFKEEITFENVNFEYESGKATLQNVNTNIPFAETVGLVGESGAGKSTFANLLLRLYEPNEGCILFGGIDIKEFDIKELRELKELRKLTKKAKRQTPARADSLWLHWLHLAQDMYTWDPHTIYRIRYRLSQPPICHGGNHILRFLSGKFTHKSIAGIVLRHYLLWVAAACI